MCFAGTSIDTRLRIARASMDVRCVSVSGPIALRIKHAMGPRLFRGWAGVFSAVLAAMVVNALDLGFGHMRLLVSLAGASGVSTVCLGVGWTLEPERPGHWCAIAAAASLLSAVPVALQW